MDSTWWERRGARFALCLLLLWPAAALVAQTLSIASARLVVLAGVVPALAVALLIVRTRGVSWQRLGIGLGAGLVATLAYDGTRLALTWLTLVHDPFQTIIGYGAVFAEPSDAAAVGWLLHFWNGAAFGGFFALALGAPRVWKGVAWGLFLELAQVATSPRLLRITIEGELLTASVLGHLAYGVVLARTVGLWAKAR